jgi:hypothetical protein
MPRFARGVLRRSRTCLVTGMNMRGELTRDSPTLLSADRFRVSQDSAALGSRAERSGRPSEYLLDRARSDRLVGSLLSRHGHHQAPAASAGYRGGLLRTVLVGLPDGSLYQSRDRCKARSAATARSGPSLLTINLSPATLPKADSYHVLAMQHPGYRCRSACGPLSRTLQQCETSCVTNPEMEARGCVVF